ncbi:MAG TPA: glycerol-3-phosphate dehydrogenase/oxidase [Candidatus Dormibacteraeota bacterium]|nr:glycerol-3-phosphate dehydrogenase/oxidase [Candidatus Dormibacteraeota bacterium]
MSVPANRLAGLDGAALDAVVIGGGMAGAGVARDLALRGASVALFEKGDFASGTSSKSSKLIHGGLRYLELGDFKLVRESLREKKTLERLAPHLVRPLPFLVPIYRGAPRGLITVRIGMWLYDLLTPGKTTERYRVLRPVDTLTMEPSVRAEDLRGAGYYFDDLLLYPERLCLENVLSAARHGARAFNYCEVEEFVHGRRGIEGVKVRDLLSGQVQLVRATTIVNCAGPWVDRVRAMAKVADRSPRVVRTTKGIHCLLPRMTDRAVYLSARDERMIFVIPWREFSLVGTTDTDFEGDPDRLWATREEVTYLLEEVAKVLPDKRATFDNVSYTYAGVRPLSFEPGASASKVSRDHKVIPEGPDGRFFSVTGTKLTCFRSLAEDVGNRVMGALGRRLASRTAQLALDGTDEGVGKIEARVWMDVSEEMAATGLSRGTLRTLVETYGRAYPRVLELGRKLPDGFERLCPSNPEIVAQLHHALREELAVSLQDVLLRRTGIGQSRCQGLDCAESIAGRMAELGGWSKRRLDAELEAYSQHVERSRRFRQRA